MSRSEFDEIPKILHAMEMEDTTKEFRLDLRLFLCI